MQGLFYLINFVFHFFSTGIAYLNEHKMPCR